MQGPRDAGATAAVQIDTEVDKDARAIFERARKLQEEGEIDDGNDGDNSVKTYKGINNYKKFIIAKDNTAGMMRYHPISLLLMHFCLSVAL